MWTRAILKANARAALKKNYVNVVIVSLVFAFISGTFSNSSAGNKGILSIYSGDFSREFNSLIAFVFGILIVAGVIGLILKILVFNPIEVGVRKFFIENHDSTPTLKPLSWAFKSNYLNIVKTMFLTDVYLFLWMLLFLIPGVIKSYSYRMVPYILADNPDIDADVAITLSREMMNGQKLDTFILDVSFLPWYILSAFTLNIVGIFYVFPYVFSTNAELYITLKDNSTYNDTCFFNKNNFNKNGGYYD